VAPHVSRTAPEGGHSFRAKSRTERSDPWSLGLPLTYADGGPRTVRYLAGAAALSVVLIYLAVNIAAIRAFRTEFRDQFRLWPHLLLPAAAAVLFLFPLWGSFIRAHTRW
jgi:amino acid transporter